MIVAWMVMGVAFIGLILAIALVDETGVRCSWCGDTVWDADRTPHRREYALYLGETTVRGAHVYCSTACYEAHGREETLRDE